MAIKDSIKIWAEQVRAPFLILSILLVLLGGATAFNEGVFRGLIFALCMIGVTLAHVAVNLINEYSDHKTGIDHHTQRTPFSGGSGNLQKGLTTPDAVRSAAIGTLLAALAIGIYLTWVSNWILILFIVSGGLATVFYTSHLSRWMLGELAAGICLGTFVVLGTYYAQTSTLSTSAVWASIPPGILTALLLLLNELPVVEADLQGGRRHLVIILGRKKAVTLYTIVLGFTYLVIISGVIFNILPKTTLLALFTLPLAVKAVSGALRNYDNPDALVPALGANVGVVLGTNLLLAIGYFIP